MAKKKRRRKKRRYRPDYILFNRYPSLRKMDGLAIEAGASDGVLHSNTKVFYERRNWTTVNIEPDPLLFSELQENRPENDRCINLQMALSDQEGEIEIVSVGIKGWSSVEKGVIEDLNEIGYTEKKRSTVQTTTYSKLISDLNISNVDLLSLDVEGHEISVINGMTDTEILPEVIIVETDKVSQEDISEALCNLNAKYKWHRNLYHDSFYVKI